MCVRTCREGGVHAPPERHQTEMEKHEYMGCRGFQQYLHKSHSHTRTHIRTHTHAPTHHSLPTMHEDQERT